MPIMTICATVFSVIDAFFGVLITLTLLIQKIVAISRSLQAVAMTARAWPNIIDKILRVIDRALLADFCDGDIDEWTLIPASHERLALARFFQYSIAESSTPQVIVSYMDHPATGSDS